MLAFAANGVIPTAACLLLHLSLPFLASCSAQSVTTTEHKDALPPLSYEPGNFSQRRRSSDGKVILSNGLSARPIAAAGQYVELADGTQSYLRYHKKPDAAATFELPGGGWLYVSNAENENIGTNWDDGGVGAIKFNENGDVVGYERIANYTIKNCGAGKTPWNSFVSGEEVSEGRFVQVDPYGIEPLRILESLGDLGWYESFAYDIHSDMPAFYTTRDHNNGIVTRFTPDEQGYACYLQPNDYDRWCTLEYGTIDYLYLQDGGVVDFTNDLSLVSNGYHRNVEGIDIYDGVLYFTAKKDKVLYVVNLRTMQYYKEFTSTTTGEIGFEPDQIMRIKGDDALYFCEEGGDTPGLHVRHGPGTYTTIFYIDQVVTARNNANETEETTGVAFSPDGGMHLYVAYQEIGVVYDITRDDMRSFKDHALGFGTSSGSVPSLWITVALCVLALLL